MNSQDRWFVRFRGHTLGPLTTEQIRVSIQKKEIGAADKIALASNPEWKEIQKQDSFRSLFPKTSFDTLPSPTQVLYRKKHVAIPELLPPASSDEENTMKPSEPQKVLPQPALVSPVTISPPAQASAAKEKNKSRFRTLTAKKTKGKIPQKKQRKKSEAQAKPKTVVASPGKEPARENVTAKPERKFSENELLSTSAKKEEIQAPEIAVAKILENFPARPEIPTSPQPTHQEVVETFTFLQNLRDWSRNETIPASLPLKKIPVAEPSNELQIRITLSKAWIAAIGIIFICLFGTILFFSFSGEKKRDLKNFHLSDPSSPTIQPSIQNDPIPELKAPTRPKRD